VACECKGVQAWRITACYALGYFAPFFYGLLVAAAGLWLFDRFSLKDIVVDLTDASLSRDATTSGRQADARYWVATTTLLLACMALAAAVLTVKIIGHETSAYPRRRRILTWFAALSSIAITVFLLTSGGPSYDRLGKDVFVQTVFVPQGICETAKNCPPSSSSSCQGFALECRLWGQPRDLVKMAIDIANVAATIAAVLVAVAICSLRRPLAGVTPADMDSDAADLARRIRWLKYLLVVAAVVLFFGVVQMQSWRYWPLAAWPEAKSPQLAHDNYKKLADGSIHLQAAHFTLILIAIFAPMALWLRQQARDLAQRALPGGGPDSQLRWLEARQLVLPANEMAQRVLALVSPYLAAPLLTLIGKDSKFAAMLQGWI